MPSNSNELNHEREQWRIRIRDHLILSAELKRRTADLALDSVLDAADLLVKCFRSAHKVLICGNGGSAADAQHMAAEFVNRLGGLERPGLPAIALNTDTSVFTPYANDVCYESVLR